MNSAYNDPHCDCETSCVSDCAPSQSSAADAAIGISKGALAMTGATGLACAACCVLPLAWPAIGVALSGTGIAFLERSQPWLALISLTFVAAAWLMVWWQTKRSGRRANVKTLAVVGGATALLFIVLCWRDIEPAFIAMLGS